jgi:hypothetical protein
MTAVPGETAFTSPVDDTVTTPELDVVHERDVPLNVPPEMECTEASA